MNRTLVKAISIGALITAFVILGRALYFAPNDEVDSGLEVAEVIHGSVVASSSNENMNRSSVAAPSRLIIPDIGVDAKVQHLGVTRSGNMAAPANFVDVGWYKLGTTPGKVGSAVISGHEDDAIATPAIFYDLYKLSIGDDVYVVDKDGKKLRFKVTAKKIVPYNLKGAELTAIFTRGDKARLNLITCAGDWLASAKTNDQRLIVYTELVE
jgi:LPXTG-site transpeptidase (sortase) family protein